MLRISPVFQLFGLRSQSLLEVIPTLVLTAICGCFFLGCASKNPNSMQMKEERVRVLPVRGGNEIAPFGVIATAIVPKVIDFAVTSVSQYLETESRKYTASYGGKYIGDDFYTNNTGVELTYDKIAIERFILDSQGAESKEIMASSLLLDFGTNKEGSLLTLQPARLVIHKSKAKLRKGDDNLDLLILINISGYWQAKTGEIKSRTLGEMELVLSNIKLGETYSLKKGEEGESFLETAGGARSNYNCMSDWFAPVPLSLDEKGKVLVEARGNYTIDIQVTEVDDYASKLVGYSRDLKNSKSIWSELAKRLLQD